MIHKQALNLKAFLFKYENCNQIVQRIHDCNSNASHLKAAIMSGSLYTLGKTLLLRL